MSTRSLLVARLGLAIAAAGAVGACATAPSPEEKAIAEALQSKQILPATREERDAADQKDLLSQAAFWGQEYDKNPNDYEAALKLSRVLRQIGSSSRAAEISAQALNLRQGDVDLTLVFAQASLDTGQPEAAVGPLARIEGNVMENWRAQSIIGVTLDQLGKHQEAQAYYERALAISPDNPQVLSNLALSHALEGDAAKAEDLLRTAATAPGADVRVRQNLALVLGVQGKFTEATEAAGADLPRAMVEANIAYFRKLLTPARSYDRLRGTQD